MVLAAAAVPGQLQARRVAPLAAQEAQE